MATVPLIDAEGTTSGMVEVAAGLAEQTPHIASMHQALLRQQAGARQGTHDTRTRGEVSGGGRKPYRQKGTGRARQGSIRAPHYRGGGTVFGPTPRSHAQRMPRKQRRLALRSALATALQAERIRIVEGFDYDVPRTGRLAAFLRATGAGRRVLLVLAGRDPEVELSARNLAHVRCLLAANLNVHDVLVAETVIVTREAWNLVEAHLT
ncbi:MAG TPA: 50S ribosomal protein L4 [Verrucomicrobiae bacterium]|nr:50S ribosomal protein L4 [Verrucomicrobiae bacterium]